MSLPFPPASVDLAGHEQAVSTTRFSQPLRPRLGVPPSEVHLLNKACTSWLKAAEVAKLLQRGFSGGFPLSTATADLPASGSLYLYDRRRVRYFRSDGHNWRKKAGSSSATKETHEKLRVGNVDKLNCYYAHAVDPPNLQRRCYWLLEDESLVLVHYLEAGGSDRGSEDHGNRVIHSGENQLWRESVQQFALADDMGQLDPWTWESKRRRTSLEHAAGVPLRCRPPYNPTAYGRLSLDETESRKSSMDDEIDTFQMPDMECFRQQYVQAMRGKQFANTSQEVTVTCNMETPLQPVSSEQVLQRSWSGKCHATAFPYALQHRQQLSDEELLRFCMESATSLPSAARRKGNDIHMS